MSDRDAVWYHGVTRIVAADGDAKDRTLWLDGRAEGGPTMAQAVALALPNGLQIEDVKLEKSEHKLSLNVSAKWIKIKRILSRSTLRSPAGVGMAMRTATRALAQAARKSGFERLLADHRAAWH